MLKNKINIYEIGIILLLIATFSINPPQIGSAKKAMSSYEYKLDTTVLSPVVEQNLNIADQKIEEAKQLNKKLDKLPNKPRIIYKTRTVTPKTITLYIRHKDGTITEREVTSDGGFYIIQEDSIISGEEVEIEEDTTPRKRWYKKIFQ